MSNRVILVMGHIGIEPSLILRHAILQVEHSHCEYGIAHVGLHEPKDDLLSMEELFSNLQEIIEIVSVRGSTRSDLVEFAKGQRGLSEALQMRGEMPLINSLDEELRDFQYFFEQPKQNEVYRHYKWKSRLRGSINHHKTCFQRKTFPKQKL